MLVRSYFTSYPRNFFAAPSAIAAAIKHAAPPVTTDSGAPIKAAAVPASTSPNCGPPMKKIILIEVMRPRSLFGVASWRIVWRRIVLIVSAAPVIASIYSESQNTRDKPNAIVAAPKIPIDTMTSTPCLFSVPNRAITKPVIMAPPAGAAARNP